MAVLVFVESAEGKIKSNSLEAVAYAKALGQSVTAIALGSIDQAELKQFDIALEIYQKGIVVAREQNERKALQELQSAYNELLFELE